MEVDDVLAKVLKQGIKVTCLSNVLRSKAASTIVFGRIRYWTSSKLLWRTIWHLGLSYVIRH